MIIISDTSPIINLAVIGQLDLLQKLYGRVVIPQAVYEEIVIEGVGQAGATEVIGRSTRIESLLAQRFSTHSPHR